MVFKVIASACRYRITHDSTHRRGSIRFIGGFPNGWPMAAYMSCSDETALHDSTRLGPTHAQASSRSSVRKRKHHRRQRAKVSIAGKLVEASSFTNNLWGDGSRHLREELEITSDDFGAPHLVMQGAEGPGISFSYSKGTIWAALCREGLRCGIDAALGNDFTDDYPFQRVFSGEEIKDFLPVTDGSTSEAAALVWSAKEAVVKALGCAFHLVDPLEVRIRLSGELGEAIHLSAELNARVQERLSEHRIPRVSLATVLMRHTWVSLAVMNWNRFSRCDRLP